MLNKVKNITNRVKQSQDGRTLVANFGYLTLLQVAGYVFPLVTMPYLARVIGVDGFGKIAFASAIIIWFQTIADWGFNLTATRDVAKNRDNPAVVSEIFSSVLWARCLLTVVALIILLICIYVIPTFKDNADMILASFLLIPGHIMFPDWFFQAIEKMKYTTYLNILFKSLFTVAIFIFIKDKDDYILQPLLTSLGYVICGIITMYIIVCRWGIKVRWVSWHKIWQTIVSSTDVFINNIFPNIYKAFSTILLGFVGGTSANGLLDAGSKFEDIVNRFLNILSRIFFPFLSRRIDKHTLFAKLYIGISSLSAIVLFLSAPLIIRLFFSPEFYDAIPVLQILSLSLLFLAMTNVYGANYLIISGHEKELRNLTIICSLVGFVMSFVLVYKYTYIGAAITITATRGLLGVWTMIKAKQLMKK